MKLLERTNYYFRLLVRERVTLLTVFLSKILDEKKRIHLIFSNFPEQFNRLKVTQYFEKLVIAGKGSMSAYP